MAKLNRDKLDELLETISSYSVSWTDDITEDKKGYKCSGWFCQDSVGRKPRDISFTLKISAEDPSDFSILFHNGRDREFAKYHGIKEYIIDKVNDALQDAGI